MVQNRLPETTDKCSPGNCSMRADAATRTGSEAIDPLALFKPFERLVGVFLFLDKSAGVGDFKRSSIR